MPVAINTFRNVRTRIHRIASDAQISGWVTHLAREEARLRLWSFAPFAAQERIACECYGQGTVARFAGVVVAQAGHEVAVELIGSISYAPSEETPRIYASGLIGSLQGGECKNATMMVLDVSPLSLGAIVDTEFQVGDELAMSLPTEMGAITAQVSVANSRVDADDPSHFRIGLHINDMARLDRARWGRLVSERAEA